MLARLKRAALAAALLCASTVLADPAPELTKPDVDAWLDGFVPYALQQGDIGGAVVVVVKDGSILTQRGFGYADLAAHEPMDPERTLMRVGSISKLFTWTALMQLVERGQVSLDADVNSYLDFRIPPRDGQPITVRNLMTHTPGFEEQLKNAVAYDSATAPKFETLLKRWTPERIFAPGTTPAYSNYATALAGYIVQRISGVPLEDYMDTHVLGPLGMTSSTFRQPLPSELQPRMAKGYAAASGPARPFEIIGLAPAGALSAPATDIAKFMLAHLNQGRLGEAGILRAETAQLMHGTPLTILPRVDRMLLGFWEANYKGRRVIAHGGDTQWFHSDLRLYIDDGVGMFVACNSMGKGMAAIDMRIELFEEFANRYLPVPEWSAGPGVDEQTAGEHAQLMAGHYVNSRRSESSFMSLLNLVGAIDVIDYRDGTIGVSMVRNGSGQPRRWREVQPFVWQLDGSSRLLSAEVRDGAVARFSFDEVSPFMMFERPAPSRASWLTPAFLASLIAMVATAVAWPISALMRRRYGMVDTRSAADAKAYRWLRIAAITTVAMWLAWIATIGTMMSDLSNLSEKFDTWLWTLHVLSVVTLLGGVIAALWHAKRVLRGERRWCAKVWALAMVLAMNVSLWMAVAYNVIASGVNY
ncbi:FmtA-like protein [Steroidobacter agaridevorans]|uniref:FmtA-like protein n=1 Tax=Steroidobacter agaridevorans TaxID=2695856 RepID=A0A829YPV9_9GAMM|nr:serine hydrolase domain-containing protein [Steroidobacter agaridevorans]GFE84833.1 FmtA-like protein [Steroidobacter agaridevorans]